MGKVALEGMDFFAKHGYYEEEQAIGNRYTVDVVLEVDFQKAADEDDLEGTINYEEVYKIVSEVMSEPTKLLEHLAGKIVHSLRSRFQHSTGVLVKISKHNPPIGGICEKATIELEG